MNIPRYWELFQSAVRSLSEYQPSRRSLLIFAQALQDQGVLENPLAYRIQAFKSGAVGLPSVYPVQRRIREIVEELLANSDQALLRTAESKAIIGTCVWEQGGLGGADESLEWPLASIEVFSGNRNRSALEQTLQAMQYEGFLGKRGQDLYLHRKIDPYLGARP